MVEVTSSIPPKANLSLKVPVEVKEALQRIAKSESRSVHFLLIEAVENYLSERQADEEYDAWVAQRVLKAQKSLHENGSSGISMEEAHRTALDKVKKFLENN